MRKLLLLLAVPVLLLAFAVPAFAGNGGNVIHSTINEEVEVSFPVGPSAACYGIEGIEESTLVDAEFTIDLKVTEFVDGPQAGRVHLRGQHYGTYTIPVDGTEVTGSFVNQQNEIISSDDHIFKRVVKLSATAPDGSEIKILLNERFVIQDGDVKVEVGKVNCIK